MPKLNLESIIEIVKENPNNYKLGQAIRKYVSENENIKYVDTNQLSFDFDTDVNSNVDDSEEEGSGGYHDDSSGNLTKGY